MRKKPSCSFCKKSAQEATMLLKGHSAFICDECITIAMEIALLDLSSLSSKTIFVGLTEEQARVLEEQAISAVDLLSSEITGPEHFTSMSVRTFMNALGLALIKRFHCEAGKEPDMKPLYNWSAVTDAKGFVHFEVR